MSSSFSLKIIAHWDTGSFHPFIPGSGESPLRHPWIDRPSPPSGETSVAGCLCIWFSEAAQSVPAGSSSQPWTSSTCKPVSVPSTLEAIYSATQSSMQLQCYFSTLHKKWTILITNKPHFHAWQILFKMLTVCLAMQVKFTLATCISTWKHTIYISKTKLSLVSQNNHDWLHEYCFSILFWEVYLDLDSIGSYPFLKHPC